MTAPGLLVLALLASPAGQASSESVWRAEYTTSEGRSHAFTLTLRESEGTLSGTISSHRGTVPITSGAMKDREVAFTVTRRSSYDTIDVIFTGAIDGDLMRLSMRAGPRAPVAITARRQVTGSTPVARHD